MQDIFLICTTHENLGICNSQELYKFFERIKPDMIFEEIPLSYYDQYYVSKVKSNLESIVISAHIQDYQIKILLLIPMMFLKVIFLINLKNYISILKVRLIFISSFFVAIFNI